MHHSIGKSGIFLCSEISVWNSLSDDRTPELRVSLVIRTDKTKEQFASLQAMRGRVEASLGFPLLWDNSEDRKSRAVYVQKNADFFDEKLWPEQQAWLKETLERFQTVFAPLAHKLDGDAVDN
jgi:hypothetical protein